jgi:hypothetical protein
VSVEGVGGGLGRLFVGAVARAGDGLEARAGDLVGELSTEVHRAEAVALAPDDQGGRAHLRDPGPEGREVGGLMQRAQGARVRRPARALMIT